MPGPPKYGSIDIAAKIAKMRKPRAKKQIPTEMTPQILEQRLAELSFQNRAPSVAKSATETLLERKVPKKAALEVLAISAADAVRIADIYERLFGPGCPKCGFKAEGV